MSFVADEGTRFTIVSNNGTFKVVREYMGIVLMSLKVCSTVVSHIARIKFLK